MIFFINVRTFISKLIGLAILSFLLSSAAQAQTPPEVLKPYKEYRAALKADDTEEARKQGYLAWQQAEEFIGASKITGDLAYNYAVLPIERFDKKKDKKRIEKAFNRSMELASFHGDLAADAEIQRYMKLIDFKLTNVNFKNRQFVPDVKKADIYKLQMLITQHGKLGTTYEAEFEAIQAQYYHMHNDDETALTHAERSLELFKTRSDDIASTYPYVAKLFKGKSLDAMGKKIPAALVYQDVMQNLEGNLEPDHPFVSHAFGKWMWIRNDIERAGDLEKAEAAGLCECWPYDNYKNQPFPLVRTPPIMPPRAERSGHVVVMFDLTDTGLPVNITKVSASSEVFVKSALKSVEGWRFSAVSDKTDEDFDPEARKALTNVIRFRLSDVDGSFIPE